MIKHTPANFEATSFDHLVHEFGLVGEERNKARCWFLAGLKMRLKREAAPQADLKQLALFKDV